MRRLNALLMLVTLQFSFGAAASDDLQKFGECLANDDIGCLSAVGLEILEGLDNPDTRDLKITAAAHFATLQSTLGREEQARRAWQLASETYNDWIVSCRSHYCRWDGSDVILSVSQRLHDDDQKIASQNIIISSLYEGGLSGPRRKPNGDLLGWYRGQLFEQLVRLGGIEQALSYYEVARGSVTSVGCIVTNCRVEDEFVFYAKVFSSLGEDDLMVDAVWIDQRALRIFRGFLGFGLVSWPLSEAEYNRRRFSSSTLTFQDLTILSALSLCHELKRCEIGREMYDELMIDFERPWPSNAEYPAFMRSMEHFTDLIVHAEDAGYFANPEGSPASGSTEDCMAKKSVVCLVEQIRSWTVGRECPSGYRAFGVGLATIASHVARTDEKDLARALLVEAMERTTGPVIEGGSSNGYFDCTDFGHNYIPDGAIPMFYLRDAETMNQRELLLDWMRVNSDAHARELKTNKNWSRRIVTQYGTTETYLAMNRVGMAVFVEADDLIPSFLDEAQRAFAKRPPGDEAMKFRLEGEIANYLTPYSLEEAYHYFLSARARFDRLDLNGEDLVSYLNLYYQMRSMMSADERATFLGELFDKVRGDDNKELSVMAIILTRLAEEQSLDPVQFEQEIVHENYWNPAHLICPECREN